MNLRILRDSNNVCPGVYPYGGDHVLRHTGDGTKHPFRYAFY